MYGAADNLKQLEPCDRIELARFAVLVDGFAEDVLHNEVRKPVFSGPAIQQASDIGVIQAREDLTLAVETAHNVVRVHAALNELDCDLFPERIVVAGSQVHGSH